MALTREQILARKAAGRTLEVELDPGETVVVRGMSRGEAAEMRALDQDDVIGLEAFALHTCLVDPALTLDEAREWVNDDGSEHVQRVIDAVQRLSGHAAGQAKGYTKSVSGKRRARR